MAQAKQKKAEPMEREAIAFANQMLTGRYFLSSKTASNFADRTFRSKVISILLEKLAKGNKTERKNAANALGFLGDNRLLSGVDHAKAVRGMVAGLRDKNTEVKAAIISNLGDLGDRSVVSYLIPYIRQNDVPGDVRYAALHAVGSLKATEAVPHLIGLLRRLLPARTYVKYMGNRDAALIAVIETLAEIGDPRAVPTLVKQMNGSIWGNVRVASIKALAEIGDRGSIRPLVQLFRSQDPSRRLERAQAIRSLARFKGSDVSSILLEALNDRETDVQLAGIEVLASRVPPVANLEMSLNNVMRITDNPRIKRAIQAALQTMRKIKKAAKPKKAA